MKWTPHLSSWNDYKYRFVPWLVLNWKNRTLRKPEIENGSIAFDELLATKQIMSLCETFDVMSKKRDQRLSWDYAMMSCWGFQLKKTSSRIPHGGLGVFVSDGLIPRHHVVTLYPGTVYQASDPMFLQSIQNPFILRCIDGILIDGKRTGLSRAIFKSCAGREIIGTYQSCDMSWLQEFSPSPLGIGQYVNNQIQSGAANVAYEELDVAVDFPIHIRQYIPNVNYKPSWEICDKEDVEPKMKVWIRLVVLVAQKNIYKGEELYSSYFTQINLPSNGKCE